MWNFAVAELFADLLTEEWTENFRICTSAPKWSLEDRARAIALSPNRREVPRQRFQSRLTATRLIKASDRFLSPSRRSPERNVYLVDAVNQKSHWLCLLRRLWSLCYRSRGRYCQLREESTISVLILQLYRKLLQINLSDLCETCCIWERFETTYQCTAA